MADDLGLAPSMCIEDASVLAETYRIERAKWNAIAEREMAGAKAPLPFRDFEHYAHFNSSLSGVAQFLGDLRGKRVLEYCCGMGQATVALARSGAQVSCFDLSPGSIEVTRARLAANGVEADAIVAAGEQLPYADEEFDLVFGESALHHLDVTRAADELHRVVKPGGRAGFFEPMGMNPLLDFAREHVPYRQKAPRGAGRPLNYDEIDAWTRPFSSASRHETQLLSMLERFWGYEAEITWLRRLDQRLLVRAPFLRRYCRYVGLHMVKYGSPP